MYEGEGRLQEHVVRVLNHLENFQRCQFETVGDYVEFASRMVKKLYNVKYLKAENDPITIHSESVVTDNTPQLSLAVSLQNAQVEGVSIDHCGVGFGETFWYVVQRCMRDMAVTLESQSPRRIRFWGIIKGLVDELHVFEIQYASSIEYMVTSDLCPSCKFERLPPPSEGSYMSFFSDPRMISGHLSDPSTLTCLSTMISVIASETTLGLAGQYSGSSRIDTSSIDPMLEGSWVNIRTSLINPSRAYLSPISDWTFRDCSGVTLLENSVWTGASVVYNKGRVSQIYEGFGIPKTLPSMFETRVPEIQSNRDDLPTV
jgi:hypothetical protein